MISSFQGYLTVSSCIGARNAGRTYVSRRRRLGDTRIVETMITICDEFELAILELEPSSATAVLS
jgi:hypothetical protein